jgi:hypothetical protein
MEMPSAPELAVRSPNRRRLEREGRNLTNIIFVVDY